MQEHAFSGWNDGALFSGRLDQRCHQKHRKVLSQRVAEVTDDTFYATRLAEEAEFVRTHMPANTRRTSDGTFVGWYFAITNEFGDTYKLFLYYHKGMGVYRVVLVDPRLEGKADE